MPRTAKQLECDKAVRKALRDGTLVRPETCEECDGALAFAHTRPLHAAHYNYDEPLRIRWLCSSCHKTWDALRAKVSEEHREKPLSVLYGIVSSARRFAHETEFAALFGEDRLRRESEHFAPLGEYLKYGRQSMNLTQSEMAARAGMSQGYLSRVERGSTPPSLEAANSITHVFASAVPGVATTRRDGERFRDIVKKAREGGK